MQPESPAQKPRRYRHLVRWIFIGILAILGWYGWKAYDFRQAEKQAKELGWTWIDNDPIATIRKNWKDAFLRKTWFGANRRLYVSTIDELERPFEVIDQLKPDILMIHNGFELRRLPELKNLHNLAKFYLDYSKKLKNIDALKQMKRLELLSIKRAPALASIDALKELHHLTELDLSGCSALADVNALHELKSLKTLTLGNCTGLTNADGILGLTQLNSLDLRGCKSLTKEAVEALKIALPNTKVYVSN